MSHYDNICIYVIMSPLRRLDEHDQKRTRPAPRSHPAALARRTPLRYLPRLESRYLLVRQMVGHISTRPTHRLCRPFACPAPFAPADAHLGRTSRGHGAAVAGTGYDPPNALRLDWR